MEDGETGRARSSKRVETGPLLVIGVGTAGGRDDHDRHVNTAGKLEKPLNNSGVGHAPTDKYERSFSGSDLLCCERPLQAYGCEK